jgi:hypothetical protein
MILRNITAALASTFVLAGCVSDKVQYVQRDIEHMTPAELIQRLGPPSRIEFEKQIWGRGGLAKGCQNYRYYVINSAGDVGYYCFYYKNQEWVSSTSSFCDSQTRQLDISKKRDRAMIEEFEANHPHR